MRAGRFIVTITCLWVALVTVNCRHETHRRRNVLQKRITLSNGMSFVRLQPGKVWFAISEVSNAEFGQFSPTHESGSWCGKTLGHSDQPVVNVSWVETEQFCQWLTEHLRTELPEGFHFRVPRVAEWETAASCGTAREYPWGDALPIAYGNYADRSFISAFPEVTENKTYSPLSSNVLEYDDQFAVSCPVSLSETNEWGIRGMSGNVREWCLDVASKQTNEYVRIIKGQSWACSRQANLCSIRSETVLRESQMNYDLGIRLVIAPVFDGVSVRRAQGTLFGVRDEKGGPRGQPPK